MLSVARNNWSAQIVEPEMSYPIILSIATAFVFAAFVTASCGDGATPTDGGSLPVVTSSSADTPGPTLPLILPPNTPTPDPAVCEPLGPMAGWPVWMGRRAATTCVGWVPGDGPVVVRLQDRPGPEAQPTNIRDFAVPAGSPLFAFPVGLLPPLQNRCFQQVPPGLEVVVIREGGVIGGVTAFAGCPVWKVANGCSSPHPPRSDAQISRTDDGRACMSWFDTFNGETGYRLELSYPGSQETFTYRAPPNTVTFIFPEADVLGMASFGAGLGRKDFAYEVWAVMPDGSEQLAGAGAVIVG